MGRACNGQHEAYYRVIDWPELNALRQELGLPHADLHVTVGFKTQDIHGVKKDVHTICEADEFEGLM